MPSIGQAMNDCLGGTFNVNGTKWKEVHGPVDLEPTVKGEREFGTCHENRV